jgi:Protein phosphatase 2C
LNYEFLLPPAQAGEKYTGVLHPAGGNGQSIRLLDVRLPPDLPLSLNLAAGSISGVVSEPGDYEIEFDYYVPNNHPIQEIKGKSTLVVVPNPKTMWKNLPSNPAGLHSVPDQKSAFLINDNLCFLAASKRGRSHAHVGSYREDDFALAHWKDWTICVVSDGAGSSKYSRKGAEIVCTTLTRTIVDCLSREKFEINDTFQYFVGVFEESIRQTVGAIELACKNPNESLSYRDFYATALVCITKNTPKGLLLASYAVGDGAIAAYNINDSIELLMSPDSGDYSGQTKFLDFSALNISDIKNRTKINLLSEFSAVFLMSDGITDPFFETDLQLTDHHHWKYLWEQLSDLGIFSGTNNESNLLEWLDFWSKGNHDDRTILIIYPEAYV